VAALHGDDAVGQTINKATADSVFCCLLLRLIPCCLGQLMVLTGVAVALVQPHSQQHVMVGVQHARGNGPAAAATAHASHKAGGMCTQRTLLANTWSTAAAAVARPLLLLLLPWSAAGGYAGSSSRRLPLLHLVDCKLLC
jgi:hypothetical protein